jgi:DNA repair protein RadD
MDSSTREQLLGDLGAGRLKVLTSCQLIGEGVDVPSVAGCILLRPTQSVSLHLQMIGRCLRPQPGKTAVILDHVGNVLRLGHHLEEREWSLDGTPKKTASSAIGEGLPGSVSAVLPSAPNQLCPDCGHEFVAERRELVHVDGELEEITTVSRKREQARATTLQDLIQVGQRRNMKNPVGWARHVLAARETKGHWARVS